MSEDRKPTLGEFLRAEREKRGLTIEQTSSATKIGLKILRQLEADQYSELPALPFVRGFVRNYGKFLGLDGEKLLKDYAGFLEEHANERPKRDAGHSGYAFERPDGEQSRKVLWGVMAGMLIFGGAVVVLFKPAVKRRHHRSEPLAPPSSSPSAVPSPQPSASPSPGSSPSPSVSPSPGVAVQPSPSPVVVPKPSPSPLPSPSPSPSPSPQPSLKPSPLPSPSPALAPLLSPEEDQKRDPLQSGTNYPPKEVRYKLVFRTKADVWVRYRCDDKKLMKFALKAGKILVLRGKQRVHFQVSNSDSITLQINGSSETFLSSHPATFSYAGNSTVVWPIQARENIEQNFNVGPALPATPSSAETE